MDCAYLLYGQVGTEFGAVSLQVHRLVRLTPGPGGREIGMASRLAS
jgi:hypothetical protein